MKQSIVSLKKIEIQNFLPKTTIASIKISYTRDNQQESMYKDILLSDAEKLTEALIREIKDRCKIELAETDDPLGSIFIVKFQDEEKTEEKLYNFLAKICEKSRYLKHMSNHQEYMKIYDEIKIQRMNF